MTQHLPGIMDLGEKFAVVLPVLFERGFTFPVHLCAVARNGAVFACSYERGRPFPEIKLLAKSFARQFTLPIAVIFLNASTAECACVVFEDRELEKWRWQ